MTSFISVKLSDVATVNPRLMDQPGLTEAVSFVPMSAVDAEAGSISHVDERQFGEVRKGYTLFKNGDILLAKITPCFENGKIAQAHLRHDFGAGSTEFHIIRPDPSRLHSRYALHFLRQSRVRRLGERRMTGSAGQRRVPEAFVTGLELPLPSLKEQRRIAEVLDQADELRAKRRQALAHLDDLTQSIFLDMVGDPIHNPMGWPRRTIGELGIVTTGNTPPRSRQEYYGGCVEWIKSDNIVPELTYLTKADESLSAVGREVGRVVGIGSVLVTCIAGSPSSIGNAALADREVAFNQQINAITPRQMNSMFLFGQLRVGKRLIQEQSTAGMKGLVSKSRLESVSLLDPPATVQQEYATRAQAVEDLKAIQRAQLAELDALFASLQDRAFRGLL